MKISVVIPIYNVERYLDRCLMSILNQTYSELEIILVNDGSTDNSLAIAQRYARQDERFVLVSQSNAGLSAARNTGLEIATGEYVAFIDSDDWIEPIMFEELSLFFQLEEYDFVCFRLQFDNLRRKTNFTYGKNYAVKSLSGTINILKDALYVKNIPTAVWAKIYKRSFLEKYNIQFKEGIVNEDTLFTLQVACRAIKVGFVNQVFYHAIEREGSISRSSYERLFVDMHTALVCAREEIIAKGVFDVIEPIYQCRYVKSMLYNLLQSVQRLSLAKYKTVSKLCFDNTSYLNYASSVSNLPFKHRLMYKLSRHKHCFFYIMRILNSLGFRMH